MVNIPQKVPLDTWRAILLALPEFFLLLIRCFLSVAEEIKKRKNDQLLLIFRHQIVPLCLEKASLRSLLKIYCQRSQIIDSSPVDLPEDGFFLAEENFSSNSFFRHVECSFFKHADIFIAKNPLVVMIVQKHSKPIVFFSKENFIKFFFCLSSRFC